MCKKRLTRELEVVSIPAKNRSIIAFRIVNSPNVP